jgi:uncharacterized protein YndB with AHSA1/START domain
MTDDLGLIQTTGDTRSLHFERRLPHAVKDVWSALTDPRHLSEWFTTAELDAREGGSVAFDFGEHGICTGAVTACESPRVLEYEWRFPDGPSSLVRWELRDVGGSTLLTVTHTLMPADRATGYAAGWHAYLGSLSGHLAGTPTDWQSHFDELLPRYVDLSTPS